MKKIIFTSILLVFVSFFYSCDSSENIGHSSDAREARVNTSKTPLEIKTNDSIPRKTLKYKSK